MQLRTDQPEAAVRRTDRKYGPMDTAQKPPCHGVRYPLAKPYRGVHISTVSLAKWFKPGENNYPSSPTRTHTPPHKLQNKLGSSETYWSSLCPGCDVWGVDSVLLVSTMRQFSLSRCTTTMYPLPSTSLQVCDASLCARSSERPLSHLLLDRLAHTQNLRKGVSCKPDGTTFTLNARSKRPVTPFASSSASWFAALGVHSTIALIAVRSKHEAVSMSTAHAGYFAVIRQMKRAKASKVEMMSASLCPFSKIKGHCDGVISWLNHRDRDGSGIPRSSNIGNHPPVLLRPRSLWHFFIFFNFFDFVLFMVLFLLLFADIS